MVTYWVDNIAPARVRPRTLVSYRAWSGCTYAAHRARRLDQLKPEHLEQSTLTSRQAVARRQPSYAYIA